MFNCCKVNCSAHLPKKKKKKKGHLSGSSSLLSYFLFTRPTPQRAAGELFRLRSPCCLHSERLQPVTDVYYPLCLPPSLLFTFPLPVNAHWVVQSVWQQCQREATWQQQDTSWKTVSHCLARDKQQEETVWIFSLNLKEPTHLYHRQM